MTWIRPASVIAALAALFLGSACARQHDARSEQPTARAAEQAPPSQTADQTTAEQAPPAADSNTAVASTVHGPGGEPVALASAWESGPAVLVFYRGHW